VTRNGDWEPKGINYRMSPGNVGCLTAARIDCCVLANNHVLDWGAAGLDETLATLRAAGIATAGAGRNRDEAESPCALPGMRVFAVAHENSGVPAAWGARVALRADLSADSLAARLLAARRPGEITILSVHWGSNWGYGIGAAERRFAHALIESGAVDVLHGHSSHHPKAVEVHRGKLVLYGCGDLVNDYEGIGGHEEFRGDLGLMYFPCLDASGDLQSLEMTPMQMRRFQLRRPSDDDRRWLCQRMDRECRRFGAGVEPRGERLVLRF
jgi:poly-gamma-glutamate synthesis protein (capsule biosynthesis protein)